MPAPVPFDRFLAAVRAADPTDHPTVAPAEFEAMRAYLLRLYESVHPVGTHLDPSGNVVDCIPFDQFPTVRAARDAGVEVARSAPRPAGFAPDPASGPRPAPIPSRPRSPCPAGAVPFVRVTLDSLVPFGSLDRYLNRAPVKGPPPEPESAGPDRPAG